MQVKIINEPFKIGILENHIFLEIHEALTPEDTNNSYENVQLMIKNFMIHRRVVATIDWVKVKQIFEKKTGVPTLIAEISSQTT